MAAARRRLRVGIIGAGEFAADCHIPGIQSHPDAELVALCGRRFQETRALADRFQVPDVHTDYRELCRRRDIDAVTIVTPDTFHRDQAVCSLTHGKHVLCEKPLAMNVAEARQMVAAAEKSGLVHQVGFIFRYNDGIAELRRRITAGEIGEPFYLRIQYDTWDGLRPDWKVTWRERYELGAGGVIAMWVSICSISPATSSEISNRRPGFASTCLGSALTRELARSRRSKPMTLPTVG